MPYFCLLRGCPHFLEPCLSAVNLLSAANQSDDNRPVLVSFHNAWQHLGFRLVAPKFLKF
jgi:hypothetical protein